MKTKPAHRHGWMVGLFGLAIGVTLIVGFPKLHAVAGAILLVALFHLVGVAVVVGSLYSFAPGRCGGLQGQLRKRAPDAAGYDFG